MPLPLTYEQAVLLFLQGEYGHLRGAAKLLARAAGVSHRTAEAWLAQRNAPSGAALLNLMVACPALETVLSETVATRRAELRREAETILRAAEQREARYAASQGIVRGRTPGAR